MTSASHGSHVTCALCGCRRRLDGRRVVQITQPESFPHFHPPVTIEPPAHVCASHLAVRDFIARTEPSAPSSP